MNHVLTEQQLNYSTFLKTQLTADEVLALEKYLNLRLNEFITITLPYSVKGIKQLYQKCLTLLEENKFIYLKPNNKYSVNSNFENIEESFSDKVKEDLSICAKYTQMYNSAVNRGLTFDLSLYDIKKLLKRKYCAYTGIELTNNGQTNCRTQRTIERIDSKKGYVKGNVIAVSFVANQLKNIILEDTTSKYFLDSKEFKQFIKNVEKHS